ncbi:MAG TPA: AsmA-like C-terminal region-containing protein [Vicinamibacterales bacterium]
MIRKLILVVLAVVVIIIAAAAGAAYWFFSRDGVRLAIEQQASAWLGQPVKVGRASARILPRAAIFLADISIGEPARVKLAAVQLSTDAKALLSRRVEDATVTISDSRIELPLPFTLPDSGSAPSNQESSAAAVKIVSIRAISLRNIQIVSRGREIRVSADSSLAGDKLTLRSFTAQSGSTALDAEGEATLSPTLDARLRVKANKLDVDELLALADAFTPPPSTTSSRKSATPSRIAARVSAEKGSAGGIEVQQFATDLEMVGDRVTLSPLSFQLFGGRYQGSLNANLSETMSLALRSRIENLDVAKLAAFGGSPDTITGTLTGAGNFSGDGADVATVLKNARGMGTASVVNGEIKRLNLVRTVVLFFGKPAPDTAKGTDKFDRMDASFSLAHQVFSADAFSLHSPDVEIAGKGTFTAGSQALDGGLDLSLSEALSAQAGTDLRRYTREGNRIVLPARIGGTLSGPHLSIDAAAALQRGLRNEVQRRLQDLLGGIKQK